MDYSRPGNGPLTSPKPASEGADLVFAMHRLTWRTSRARPGYFAQDRLNERLASDPPVRVLLVDHPSSVFTWGARTIRQGRVERPTAANAQLCTPMRLRREDPNGRSAIVRSYQRYATAIRARTHFSGMRRPHVLTTNPLFAAFGSLGWASSVTYHATDDFADVPIRGQLYRWAYEVLAANRAIRISAVTPKILEAVGRPDGRVIANGLEPAEWSGPPQSAPKWFVDLPSPRLVYVGGVTNRLDVDAVARAAAATPQGTIVIIGRVFDVDHVAPLRGLRNVVFHDPVGRGDVVSILSAADLGLVPHVVNPMTLAMSPLKAYEYLAAGLPILSTPLPAMAGIAPRVRITESESFGEAVTTALGLGRAPQEERAGFVRAHSWRKRHDELLALALSAQSPGEPT